MSDQAISPDVVEAMKNDFDLRWFVYAYTYQHSEATKASIAEKLGISAITLSRAIVPGKKGIDPAWVPMILDMMDEIDYREAVSTLQKQEELIQEKTWYDRSLVVIPALQQYLKTVYKDETWEFEDSRRKIVWFRMEGETGSEWRFYDLMDEGQRTDPVDRVRLTLMRRMRFRLQEKVRSSFICYDPAQFDELTGERMERVIQYLRPHKEHVSIMLLDLQGRKVESEYSLSGFDVGLEVSEIDTE